MMSSKPGPGRTSSASPPATSANPAMLTPIRLPLRPMNLIVTPNGNQTQCAMRGMRTSYGGRALASAAAVVGVAAGS